MLVEDVKVLPTQHLKHQILDILQEDWLIFHTILLLMKKIVLKI